MNAVDYLLKPFSFDRFLKAVQRITTQSQEFNNNEINGYFYVKVNKHMVKINFSDLLYIEGLSNYIKNFAADESHVVYEKLSSISANLPSNSFKRIHKSYIVNTKKNRVYTREYVEIGKKQIPIGSTYRADLLTFLKH